MTTINHTSTMTKHALDPDLTGNLEEIDLGMTNFDGSIDVGFEEALKRGGVFGRHAAREFNGIVWFENGLFHEQVWRYHSPVALLSSPSLEFLMQSVNESWGWE